MATKKPETTPAVPAKRTAEETKALVKARAKARDAALLTLSQKYPDDFRQLLVTEFAARGLEYKGRARLSEADKAARAKADAEKAAKALARAQARAAKAGVTV
jgi:hypothetical protein